MGQSNKAIQKASSLYYWLKDNADAHGLDEGFFTRRGIDSLIKAEIYIGDIDKANLDIKHLVANDHIYRDVGSEFIKFGYCFNKHWMESFLNGTTYNQKYWIYLGIAKGLAGRLNN